MHLEMGIIVKPKGIIVCLYIKPHTYSYICTHVHTMQCGRISATRAFITQLGERDVRHMIIGPGCSDGAVTVAENAPFRSLTQV